MAAFAVGMPQKTAVAVAGLEARLPCPVGIDLACHVLPGCYPDRLFVVVACETAAWNGLSPVESISGRTRGGLVFA